MLMSRSIVLILSSLVLYACPSSDGDGIGTLRRGVLGGNLPTTDAFSYFMLMPDNRLLLQVPSGLFEFNNADGAWQPMTTIDRTAGGPQIGRDSQGNLYAPINGVLKQQPYEHTWMPISNSTEQMSYVGEDDLGVLYAEQYSAQAGRAYFVLRGQRWEPIKGIPEPASMFSIAVDNRTGRPRVTGTINGVTAAIRDGVVVPNSQAPGIFSERVNGDLVVSRHELGQAPQVINMVAQKLPFTKEQRWMVSVTDVEQDGTVYFLSGDRIQTKVNLQLMRQRPGGSPEILCDWKSYYETYMWRMPDGNLLGIASEGVIVGGGQSGTGLLVNSEVVTIECDGGC
jgi:hypothetical protein